ncbi:hypothetical protein M9H77_21170 [Catharanthus roseus]|uniref:Uncharacterized protein n=1 Tax=Catharanthus roseus TaxID=4058 RepID=A0ACC0APB6_CATRO|nr:hypothetical protein M9H77_21170 [Catharanthus roseus]
MDSEMCSLTDLLHQISTGPISKVREMRRLEKEVLSLVLPEDPGVTLTSPPEVAVTKGRKKTDSTKRDKPHWEHVFRVVANFVFGDEHQWPEVRRRMLYELEHSTNVYLNLVGSAERVNGLVHRIRWQDGPASYRCMMGVRYLIYTFNGFIIVPNELVIGHIRIRRGLQIGTQGLLEIESK